MSSGFQFNENSTDPSPPAAGQIQLYALTGDTVWIQNSAGTKTQVPLGSSVTQIVAGTGISVSPVGGTGVVTVTNTGVGPTIPQMIMYAAFPISG